MLKRRKFVAALMTFVLALVMNFTITAPVQSKAAEIPKASNQKNMIASTVDLTADNDNLIVSDVLTYDELCKKYAESEDISVKQAKSILDSEKSSLKAAAPAYSAAAARAASSTYREIATYLDVSSNYKPMIKWYCQTSESGSFWGITNILTTQLYREYSYWDWLTPVTITKQFSGNLYTQLQSAYQIFYIVNGDFWDYGTTTVSGGGSINIGQYAQLQFGVSYASNWYKYYYYTDVKSVQ